MIYLKNLFVAGNFKNEDNYPKIKAGALFEIAFPVAYRHSFDVKIKSE